jgi:hypothetical protein
MKDKKNLLDGAADRARSEIGDCLVEYPYINKAIREIKQTFSHIATSTAWAVNELELIGQSNIDQKPVQKADVQEIFSEWMANVLDNMPEYEIDKSLQKVEDTTANEAPHPTFPEQGQERHSEGELYRRDALQYLDQSLTYIRQLTECDVAMIELLGSGEIVDSGRRRKGQRVFCHVDASSSKRPLTPRAVQEIVRGWRADVLAVFDVQ